MIEGEVLVTGCARIPSLARDANPDDGFNSRTENHGDTQSLDRNINGKKNMNKIKEKIMPMLLIGVLVGGVAVILSKNMGGKSGSTVEVKLPRLTKIAKEGETLFNASCASCHGVNASGTDSGPPLVHKIYEPSHHGDAAFFMAPKRGVKAHHWRYGNMPPVEGITDQHTRKIVRFVRELQRANGIL